MSPSSEAPEQRARAVISETHRLAGCVGQDRDATNLSASRCLVVREVPMADGRCCDYLLDVDQRIMGVIEAKKCGTPLEGQIYWLDEGETLANIRDQVDNDARVFVVATEFWPGFTAHEWKDFAHELARGNAKDHVGKLAGRRFRAQVELAQLQCLLPRRRGPSKSMSRPVTCGFSAHASGSVGGGQ